MSLRRQIAIHGHFYQPPRENPWLEAVEVQDSAAPFHDWNERITAECYAPNTAARRLAADGRIVDIVNNFEKISFDVGPTLMRWLARHRPDVYAAIVTADRASMATRAGHGNAIAQVYNHMIMPLATRRDKVTQVRWGIDDFRRHFGRDPAGMWLPETAVDDDTLEVLAEAGLRFTILAPHQAWRIRRIGETAWHEIGEGIDPTRAYRWQGRSRRPLALFFYDGPVSRAIAFEHLLQNGETLASRLQAGFSEHRDRPQLVHAATDGESYGHHSKFGEMALASAVALIEEGTRATLTNYAAFLAANAPTHEAETRQASSWSCPHGVERWRAACGCRFDPSSQQAWRAPFREALDWLRDRIDDFYETRAGDLLKDPWSARDAYGAVVSDRHPDRLQAFLGEHQRATLDPEGRVTVRRLLEMQHNRMLMYTSCGWFFDDIAGLEPVQNLKYAAMAIQYLRELGGDSLEAELLTRLAKAPSATPGFADGTEVYNCLVRPAAVDFRRAVAHHVMTRLFVAPATDASLAYRVVRHDEAEARRDGGALRITHVHVESGITGETRSAMSALLHFGAQDVVCGVRAYEDRSRYDEMKADLLTRYADHSMAHVVRGIDDHFANQTFHLTDLFLDARRHVLAKALAAVVETHESAYRGLWAETRRLLRLLRDAETPVPAALVLVARHVLEQDVVAALEADGTPDLDRALKVLAEGQALGLTLDVTGARPALRRAVDRALAALEDGVHPDAVAYAVSLVDGARRLGSGFGRWAAQNWFFDLWHRRPAARPTLAPLAGALGFALGGEPR